MGDVEEAMAGGLSKADIYMPPMWTFTLTANDSEEEPRIQMGAKVLFQEE